MKTKVSPAIIGMFVIGAFALGVICLLAFGGVSFFAKPQRFVVYFDESVHGLTLGSPVKLRGVPVGRVVDLSVRYDQVKNLSAVAVVCEFSKDKMTDAKGVSINVAERAELQTLIDNGLRAQLGVQGLATGLLFVELDFVSPKDFPALPRVTELKYAEVPAIPSAISTFQASASEILANLKKIDFAGLSREITGLIVDARKKLDGLDVKGVAEQWQRTGAKVEEFVGSPELKQSVVGLNAAIGDLRGVLAHIDAQVGPAGKELTETLTQAKLAVGSINDASTAARKFLASHNGLGDEVVTTLTQLNEAAAAITRLADFLERNPSALLTGKKRPQ